MTGKLKTITALLIISSLLCGCSPVNRACSASGMYFDTVVSIDLYGASSADADTILDQCMSICEHYQDLFDKNTITSDIAKINSASGSPVHVDHDTAMLTSRALEYSNMSEGRFDITIAPVTALWDFHEDIGKIPDPSDLKSACKLVNFKNVSVDTVNDTVTVSGGSSIELGAAAKGYIADRIADHLQSCDISGAIINMGGDIRLVGEKPDGSPFVIGVNDPFNENSVTCALALCDMAVATSGTYERCFTIDGRKYHHIIDTSTGYPVRTDIESVTVITKSALDADCLCTVAILYGSKEAMKLIENSADTEAVFILDDGSMIMSSGAYAYIRQ